MKNVPLGVWIRLGCIAALWILLVALILKTARIDVFTLFAIFASGIVVFVPLYKKYFGNGNGRKN